MGLELRQQLKLAQQLVMTPQLQQAIKLLQLSRLELMQTVQTELLENPLLEEVLEEERRESVIAEDDYSPDTTTSDGELEKELIKSAEWDDYLGDFSSTSRQMQSRDMEVPEEGVSFEARLSSKPSLEGHLNWQMRLSHFSERELMIGDAVIGNLDYAGYLQATNQELAEHTGATPEEVESVVQRIQRLDPLGVAARTPQECLLVQLKVYGATDPVIYDIVENHLEDLEKKRYKVLTKKFKITLEDVKEYLEIIQTLDPVPGARFGSSDPVYVSPDAYVYKFNDEFVIVLNEEGMPRLQLSQFYASELKGRSEGEKEYMQERKRSAEWLIKSLYQRQRTLYKVLESIVKFQENFFEDGVTRLKPLILKDVADDIGMHESTVSRITTNKYVATPHGIFELKFFFNSALGMDDGGSVGSESVKDRIKKLISAEDSKKPISDEYIAEILKKELNVNIARRTVAKYRMAMGIESSSRRKEVL